MMYQFVSGLMLLYRNILYKNQKKIEIKIEIKIKQKNKTENTCLYFLFEKKIEILCKCYNY